MVDEVFGSVDFTRFSHAASCALFWPQRKRKLRKEFLLTRELPEATANEKLRLLEAGSGNIAPHIEHPATDTGAPTSGTAPLV
jgi:hypothetical protein